MSARRRARDRVRQAKRELQAATDRYEAAVNAGGIAYRKDAEPDDSRFGPDENGDPTTHPLTITRETWDLYNVVLRAAKILKGARSAYETAFPPLPPRPKRSDIPDELVLTLAAAWRGDPRRQRTAYQVLTDTWPPNLVAAKIRHMVDRGLLNYGVSARVVWPTEDARPGRPAARALTPSSVEAKADRIASAVEDLPQVVADLAGIATTLADVVEALAKYLPRPEPKAGHVIATGDHDMLVGKPLHEQIADAFGIPEDLRVDPADVGDPIEDVERNPDGTVAQPSLDSLNRYLREATEHLALHGHYTVDRATLTAGHPSLLDERRRLIAERLHGQGVRAMLVDEWQPVWDFWSHMWAPRVPFWFAWDPAQRDAHLPITREEYQDAEATLAAALEHAPLDAPTTDTGRASVPACHQPPPDAPSGDDLPLSARLPVTPGHVLATPARESAPTVPAPPYLQRLLVVEESHAPFRLPPERFQLFLL